MVKGGRGVIACSIGRRGEDRMTPGSIKAKLVLAAAAAVGFALLWLTPAAPALAIQVQNVAVSKVTPGSAVLVVETDVSSDVTVEYGYVPGSYSATVASGNLVRHEIAVSGLPASSRVYYRLTVSDHANPADSAVLPESGFHTARLPGEAFSFAVAGDNRPWTDTTTPPAVWSTIIGQIAAENPDLALNVGDIIYGLPTDTLARDVSKYDGFFSVTRQLTAAAPMYQAVGNHEYISAAGDRAGYEQEFTLPVNNGADAALYGEEYYSFDDGDTHFVALCTEIPGQEGLVTGNQLDWLKQDLASTTRPWKVVWMHRPLFYGESQDPWVDLNNAAAQQNKADLLATFQQYGVNVVFGGHEHYYQRHIDHGINYIITGGGGAPLYSPPAPGPGDAFGVSAYEHVSVDETAAALRVTAIDSAGNTLETFTLGAPALSVTLSRAYWASLDDYRLGRLAVDYALGNSGGDAVNVVIDRIGAGGGIGLISGAGQSLGTVPKGQSKAFTATYQVPPGVTVFYAYPFITCSDISGGAYSFPSAVA